MITGKTESGVEFELDNKVLDNMELLDALSEAEENPVHMSKVANMLLGDTQRKKLYDYLRTEDGGR